MRISDWSSDVCSSDLLTLGQSQGAHALAARWEQWLAANRRRSAHTVRAYVAAVHRLIAFLEQHRGEAISPSTFADVKLQDIRAFLGQRRVGGLANASASRELSAVRAFFGWLAEEGLASQGVLDGLRSPRVASDRKSTRLGEEGVGTCGSRWGPD